MSKVQSFGLEINSLLNHIDSVENPLFPCYLPNSASNIGLYPFDCFICNLSTQKRIYACSLPRVSNHDLSQDMIGFPKSIEDYLDKNASSSISLLANEEFVRQALCFEKGSFPVILSSPHSGTLRPSSIPDRFWGLKIEEVSLNDLLENICSLLPSNPSYIFSNLSRYKVDFNRLFLSKEAFHEKSSLVARVHAKYHLILRYLANSISEENYGLFLDLHGFDSKKGNHKARKADVILGTSYNETLIERNGKYWGKEELISDLVKANFKVYPTSAEQDDYGPLSGGIIVRSLIDFPNISAIQLEISDVVRNNEDHYSELALTIANSLKNMLE